MTKSKSIRKEFDEAGALNSLIGFHAAIGKGIFLTKNGCPFQVLTLECPDGECLDESTMNGMTRGFQRAIGALGEDCRLYQYFFRRRHVPLAAGIYSHPVIQEAVSRKLEDLNSRGVYSTEIVIVIVNEGLKQKTSLRNRTLSFLKDPVRALRYYFSTKAVMEDMEHGLDEACESLINKVENFIALLPEEMKASVLDDQFGFRILRKLVNYQLQKAEAVQLNSDDFIDVQVCDSALECFPDHLCLDDHKIAVLTLKEPPSSTFANLLRDFHQIPAEFLIVTEWKQENSRSTRRHIRFKQIHFHNSKVSIANYIAQSGGSRPPDVLEDATAVGKVSELGSCLEEVELKGRSFGQFSLTIITFSEDRLLVKRTALEFLKVFGAHDAQLTTERYNILNAWRAVLPGNDLYNLRRFWLLDTNAADLFVPFAPASGKIRNSHLGMEHLAIFESNQHTPYFFHLHHRDNGNTFVCGESGSGKSYLLNDLVLHAQKFTPTTFIFDVGHGYQTLTRLFAGSYWPLGVQKRARTINPFILPPTPENLNFLLTFVKVLVEAEGFRVSAKEETDLFEQIQNIYELDLHERRLLTFANTLNRGLRARLLPWVGDGPYATLFDNVQDNLTMESFQTFEFEGMDRFPQMLEPLLFYILHRTSLSICDPGELARLKIFVFDEAWRFLQHPQIRLYVIEALKTWRKKNAVMILATQSGDDLLHSGMTQVVVESCLTKIFLANPGVNAEAYRETFHLNQRETEWISSLIPKRQLLIKRPDGSKVVNLRVSEKEHWVFTSDPHEQNVRQAAFEKYGFPEGLNQLARRKIT